MDALFADPATKEDTLGIKPLTKSPKSCDPMTGTSFIREKMPADITTIYKLYGERVFRYTLRMLHNRAEAEDITAEVFYRVADRIKELRSSAAFNTWLFRIARNLCIDRLRRVKLQNLPSELETSSPEDAIELNVAVHEALMSLPVRYREPLILCDMEGFSAKDAAALLCITVPTLKSRLSRGRRAMRERVRALGYIG